MTKREKRLQKIRQNPKNVTFEALRLVLEDHGFTLQRTAGSHHIFRAQIGDQVWLLNVPMRKPHVKHKYVFDALEAIDAILELTDEEDKDENTD